MKKIIFALFFILTALCLPLTATACTDTDDEGYSVICTVFPAYDWTKNIVTGSDVSVKLLLDSGADLHSYNPTVKDMIAISKCDLFIYVGGQSDGWADDVLKSYPNEKRIVLNLLETLGDRAFLEEEVEGMQTEDEEEEEYDEHVWLSVKNAAFLSGKIADALSSAAPEQADIFSENAQNYINQLEMLDVDYTNAAEKATVKTMLFADRFPFLYMMKDYNVTYYAAFPGCSTEANAAPSTIRFLSDKLDELNLKYVLTIDGSDKKIADTVIRNSKNKNQTVLTLDSMQTTGLSESQKGATYLGIMKNNLDVFKTALQ